MYVKAELNYSRFVRGHPSTSQISAARVSRPCVEDEAQFLYRAAAPTGTSWMARLRDEIEPSNRTAVPQFWSEMQRVDFIRRVDFGSLLCEKNLRRAGTFTALARISSAKLRFINNALSSALSLATTLLLSRRWNRHPKE